MPAAPASSERYQTFVTILIALTSTAIALVAAQAAVASGNTTEAQHNGVLAKINLERSDGGTRVRLAQNRRAFDQYRFSYQLSALTTGFSDAAHAAGNTRYYIRLREESAAQYEDGVIAFNLAEAGYFIPDADAPSGFSGFDSERYLAGARQQAAIYQDIDSTDNFARADRFRTRSLTLNASLIILFASVMFLTWAQLTRGPLKWVWLGAGLLVGLGAVIVYLLSGVVSG